MFCCSNCFSLFNILPSIMTAKQDESHLSNKKTSVIKLYELSVAPSPIPRGQGIKKVTMADTSRLSFSVPITMRGNKTQNRATKEIVNT